MTFFYMAVSKPNKMGGIIFLIDSQKRKVIFLYFTVSKPRKLGGTIFSLFPNQIKGDACFFKSIVSHSSFFFFFAVSKPNKVGGMIFWSFSYHDSVIFCSLIPNQKKWEEQFLIHRLTRQVILLIYFIVSKPNIEGGRFLLSIARRNM